MNNLNYIQILLSCMVLLTIILSGLINCFEKFLPEFIPQTFRYGKFAYTNKKTQLAIEVPKSWFKHFYVYSTVITTLSLLYCTSVFVFDVSPSTWLQDFLDVCMGGIRQPPVKVNPTRIILALILLELQCVRRAYDTHCVSVFGKNSKMNLSHYLLGYVHYSACILAILGEAPKFSKFFHLKVVLQLSDLNFVDVFATVLFLWAWLHQYRVTVILGDLRKNAQGVIITQSHKLPHGDWFQYVSSPHLLAEILMYTALTFILWSNTTWWFVYVWVLTNQIETALLSHWWYQETFKDLPKTRKALIPFVY